MSDTLPEPAHAPMTLRREVGVFGAVMLGLGAIVGTGIFVSIGHAADVSGSWVVFAIVVAAGVACLNGLSSAQLAAAHPVSGGTYEYGYRWLHPSLGFTAGWMFLCAKSASAATAALGFAAYGLNLVGFGHYELQIPVGLGAVVLVTGFSLAGIRWSSRFNSLIVSITLASLSLFIAAGIFTWMRSSTASSPSAIDEIALPRDVTFGGFLQACALMFVAYTGYGRVATLGEEIRDPKRNIPIAIIATLATSMVLYVSVAWVSLAVAGPALVGSLSPSPVTPLEIVAQQFVFPETRYVIAVGAVSSMLGVLINLVLGLSRVVLAMGRRGDLPSCFAKLDRSGRTAPAAVLGVSGLIAGLVMLGNVKTTWSFSAFTVLIYYAITNMAAIKMSDEERRYPRAFAWLGLISCLFLAFWVELLVWATGLVLIAIGLIWLRLRRHLAH